MNVKLVPGKILRVADSMVGKSLLPDFSSTDLDANRVRVAALDQLHPSLQRRVALRRKQQMNMIGHENESMKRISPLPPVAVQSFQEQPSVGLHDEQSLALKGREGHEISSRRRDQTGWFHQRRPSAAKAESLRQPKAVRLEVVPFPVGIFLEEPISGSGRR